MAFMLYLIITKDGIFVDNLSLFLQNMVPLGQAIWKKIKMCLSPIRHGFVPVYPWADIAVALPMLTYGQN
jgi:hypothetical protein